MSDKKVDAWMPLWIGEYLADTTSLSRDEHGGYLLLLMAYWRNKGPLIDRGNALANIAKATPAEWRNKLRPVLAEFFSIDGERWTHGRAEKELSSAGLRKANAVGKAQAAAEARWGRAGKHPPDDASGNAPSIATSNAPGSATGIAQALHEDCPPPSPIPMNTNTPTPDGVGGDRPSADPPPLALVVSEKPKGIPDCPHLAVLALWAEVLPALPQHEPEQWGGARADHLRARWRATAAKKGWASQAEGLAYLRKLFAWCGQSDFLTGRVHTPKRRPFFVTLEWLVKPDNWANVIEGKYHGEEVAA